MKKLFYTFLISILSFSFGFSQGTDCSNATQVTTDGNIGGTLTGSNQDYYFLTPAADGNITFTISSPTGCGVRVTIEEVASPVGACVGTSSNPIFSNPGTCGGSASNTVTIPVTAGSDYYIRIVRFFAPAPEDYTLNIDSNVPLPVTLIDQKVKAEKEEVIVEWMTASEINNHYFSVEKSKDGKQFQEIGQIQSESPNSLAERNYRFIDKAVSQSAYYRIVQYDLDGSKTVLGTGTPTFSANALLKNFSSALHQNGLLITAVPQIAAFFR